MHFLHASLLTEGPETASLRSLAMRKTSTAAYTFGALNEVAAVAFCQSKVPSLVKTIDDRFACPEVELNPLEVRGAKVGL